MSYEPQYSNPFADAMKGFIIFCVAGFFIIIVWNILNFILFQWFGFRYYSLTIWTAIWAFPMLVAAMAPIVVAGQNGCLPVGIAISCLVWPALLTILRIEAAVYRKEH